jgi:hypothetical protein
MRTLASFLQRPIGARSRAMLAIAAAAMFVVYLLPLWNMTMFAPQYPKGLTLDIFDHGLVGGNNGQDIKEINLLNHYIGMRDLVVEDFTEFKWLPFVLGAIGLLFLRAATLGTVKEVVDATAVFLYVNVFALWSFGYRLYRYGHDLAPTAPVKVDGFMPPMFGHARIANFDVYSYPRAGAFLLLVVVLLLGATLWSAWRHKAPRTA